MRAYRNHLVLGVALVLVLGGPAHAQAPESASGPAARKALDHSDYDLWNRITGRALAADGRWLLYTLASEARDPRLLVHPLPSGAVVEFERAEDGAFSRDGRFVVFRIKPAKDAAEARAATGRASREQGPPDTLGILDLSTGQVAHRAARLRGFAMPERAGGWLAYQVTAERSQQEATDAERPGAAREAGQAQAVTNRQQGSRAEGHPLLVRDLRTGSERRTENVTAYRFSGDGARVAYLVSTEDGTGDGAFVLETASGRTVPLLEGPGRYEGLTFDEAGRQVAFLSDRDEHGQGQPAFALYHWDGLSGEARRVAAAGSAGIPQGWWVSENGRPVFSPDGERLYFGTAPRPEPPAENGESEEAGQGVVLDLWAWTDPLLQPGQLQRLDGERRRTYDAFVRLRDGAVVQLATAELPEVTVARRGDGGFALGRSNLPYLRQSTWGEGCTDYYLIAAEDGAAEQLFECSRSTVSMSPEARYLTWFDGERLAWFVMDLGTRTVVNVSESIPHPVHNELDDRPNLPSAHGSAGWTAGDERFLIYDAHDVWAVDPAGRAAPRNLTAGLGRREDLRFRHVRLDPEERAIDLERDLIFSAFDFRTKASGFYRILPRDGVPPARLVMEDRSFGAPVKAEEADVVILTRGSYREFPDLYVTDPAFSIFRRISDANPQQADYLWGTAELVEWRSAHGDQLQGILYKPEGFDPSRQYPMVVHFYERRSNTLHNHMPPAAGGSSINLTFYVSRGYLVFVPDIPYRIGYPGESAQTSVVPGVLNLIDKGFVDRQRVGVQGHSWGGYQISYLVTRTNLFAAAVPGAPVSNMISAYGGIRWESGNSRVPQYERGQSRIGGSLWEYPIRFIENSPIFFADKVETPLLILHNDEDGAVPWYQGIEFFVALRRLEKPVWMLNYNGEAHGLRRDQNRRDWAIRMQQFFDHYLMDVQPPVWMVEGIPAMMKGRTLGLDLVTEEPAVTAGSGSRDGPGR